MNGSGAGYYKYLHSKYAKKPQDAAKGWKPEVRMAGDNEVVTLVNAESKSDEGEKDETAAKDGFLGLFNRSEAAKKGWETRKKGGWTPGVWPKQGGSTAPAPKPAAPATPSPLSILPKHLTQNRLKNETDANRAMAGG